MYRGLDEQALARFCSQKDRLAEEELYKRYAARIYTLCGRYVGDDEEAKDLMQESIISALDKIQTFHYTGKGSLDGWIGRSLKAAEAMGGFSGHVGAGQHAGTDRRRC